MQFVFVGFSSWRLCVQLPITETKSYLSKGMSYSYDNYVNHHYHYHYHYSIHILIYNHVFYRTIHTSSKTNSRFYSTPLRSLLPIFPSLRPIFELFLMQWPQHWFLILDTVSPCCILRLYESCDLLTCDKVMENSTFKVPLGLIKCNK